MTAAPRLDPGDMAMLWELPPRTAGSLPEVIVVPDGDLRGFLAWATTYLDGYRPFTSLCRVMDARTFERVHDAEPVKRFGQIDAACAAVILADALTQGSGRVNEKSVTIPACESTYSFARSRFLVSGIRDDVRVLRQSWTLARDIAHQPRRRVAPDSAEPLWVLLDALAGNPRREQHSLFSIELHHVCNEFMRTGRLPNTYLDMTSLTSSRLGEIAEAMSENREQRVTVLDQVLRGSRLQRLEGVEADFIRGYIASLLSPGTIEYLSLVSSYIDQYPLLLMWYAFFAGLHPESKVLSQFGGLCRRLLKDVEQRETIFERPRCDISVEELEVLAATGPAALSYIRAGTQSAVRVELYPTITALVRFSTGNGGKPSLFDQGDHAQEEERRQFPEPFRLSSDISAAIAILENVSAALRGETSGRDDRATDKRKRSRRR
jgi:hypothetical protein